jgi:hypothetical protein
MHQHDRDVLAAAALVVSIVLRQKAGPVHLLRPLRPWGGSSEAAAPAKDTSQHRPTARCAQRRPTPMPAPITRTELTTVRATRPPRSWSRVMEGTTYTF